MYNVSSLVILLAESRLLAFLIISFLESFWIKTEKMPAFFTNKTKKAPFLKDICSLRRITTERVWLNIFTTLKGGMFGPEIGGRFT